MALKVVVCLNLRGIEVTGASLNRLGWVCSDASHNTVGSSNWKKPASDISESGIA